MLNIIHELRTRGMIHDMTPGTEEQLQATATAAYVGLDATAPSLQIGNLAALMLLKHLQRAGHSPVIVIGGATSMIGDPSFKATDRALMNLDTLRYNQACIQAQAERLFASDTLPPVRIFNNYDWTHPMDCLSFLRDIGKHISVNYLLAKEGIKKRLETSISYTEFAYPLLQAYDFYHLYTQHGVKLQMGGADQWGNITTGTELIKKKAQGTAFALTTPLLTKKDGTKFGKSEQGDNIWLAPNMTSPYTFYQFWLNCSDEEAPTLMRRMTLHDTQAIQALVHAHEANPQRRLLQKELAQAMTQLVHGEEACRQAIQTTEVLFGEAPVTYLTNLSEVGIRSALSGIPQLPLTSATLQATPTLIDLLSTATQGAIFPSKRAAREALEAGSVYINKVKITDPHHPLAFTWIHDKYLLVQQGKKQHYLLAKVSQD